MVSLQRWSAAQQYERSYWTKRATQISGGITSQLNWYRWRAEQLNARLCAAGLAKLTQGGARVIEIGSGPVGIAGFLNANERVLVDPLMGHYSSDPVLSAARNPLATYRSGSGEALTDVSSYYDLVIIDNCIDHVRDVDSVMREICRVLHPAGALYLTVNARTFVGFAAHRMLSRLRLDPGHPHTFTSNRIARTLRTYGFAPLVFEVESYAQATWKDLRSGTRVGVMKALLGVSEFLVSIVARRE